MKERYDTINEMLDDYGKEHKCCPECGSPIIQMTLVGFIVDTRKPTEYANRNRAVCESCGWKGQVHDLVPDMRRVAGELLKKANEIAADPGFEPASFIGCEMSNINFEKDFAISAMEDVMKIPRERMNND